MGRSGLTRKEKQSRTRAALLDAAAELFIQRGFRHVSLDEIADRAGVTKGAVYSNFADKEDLFAAVCLSRATSVDTSALVDDSLTFEEQMRALAISAGEASLSEENAALAALELEMCQLAITSERAQKWVAAAHAFNRQSLAGVVEAAAKKKGTAVPHLPPEELATILRATIQGLMQQRVAAPEAVPLNYFADAVSLLLGNPDPQRPKRSKPASRQSSRT